MHRREVISIVWLGASILVFLSLASFSPADLSILQTPANPSSQNLIGIVGAWIGFVLYSLFGAMSYLLVFFAFGLALLRFFPHYETTHTYPRITGYILLFLSLTIFLSLTGIGSFLLKGMFEKGESKFAAGMLGNFLSWIVLASFGKTGTYIILTISFLVGIILISSYESFYFFFLQKIRRLKSYSVIFPKKEVKISPPFPKPKKIPVEPVPSEAAGKEVSEPVPETKKLTYPLIASGEEILPDISSFSLPPLSLLNDPPPEKASDDSYIYNNSRKLEKALSEFGIEAKVVNTQKGPMITSYEVEPGVGVKVQSIVSLADDIALTLRARSVRIVAPIPGKSVLGIEIPNHTPRFVYLKEVLGSEEFAKSNSKLTIALGKDIRGNPLVTDLKGMPHLLIAGTTGSGKTVYLHSLIASILFNAYPHEVKFLLIDPKMVELAPFSQIPHLYAPIVTMAREAVSALQWIVEEMETRYGKLAEVGVRHIEKFNERMEKEGNESEKLPYIVVVIDELADLMTVASRKIEEMIMRLAQLSRAAGIHLVLATQRPSVDVITGIIKANFPYRMSFQVSSRVDSRTVLDVMGADKLLGKGDMLYLPAGGKPLRVQGCLVAEEEIERVVKYLEKMGRPDFNEIDFKLEKGKKEEDPLLPAENDPLFKEAVKIVLTNGQASASHLQRRMSIGYARAGRLIDLMEKRGIIGPPQGSKPRAVLVNESYLEKLEDNEKPKTEDQIS